MSLTIPAGGLLGRRHWGGDVTIISMADTPKENRGPIVPGARVRVRAGGARSAWVSGVVVDDYAAEVGTGARHEGAPVRRWAVATDDGTLVFADDGDIELVAPDES